MLDVCQDSNSFDPELAATDLTATLANGKALNLNEIIIIHAVSDTASSVKYSLNKNVKSKVIHVDKSYPENKSYQENQSNDDKSFRENPINLLNNIIYDGENGTADRDGAKRCTENISRASNEDIIESLSHQQCIELLLKDDRLGKEFRFERGDEPTSWTNQANLLQVKRVCFHLHHPVLYYQVTLVNLPAYRQVYCQASNPVQHPVANQVLHHLLHQVLILAVYLQVLQVCCLVHCQVYCQVHYQVTIPVLLQVLLQVSILVFLQVSLQVLHHLLQLVLILMVHLRVNLVCH